MTDSAAASNPLLALQSSHVPLPFDVVEPDHFIPALDAALEEARSNITAITESDLPATFDNVIVALEAADEWVDRVSTVFFHLLGADGNEAIHDLANEISPMLSAFRNDVTLNPALYAKVRAVAGGDTTAFTTEQATVLDNHLKHFERNGAQLSCEDQQKLRDLDQALSKLSPAFAQNVLKATQSYQLIVREEAALKEMPAIALQAARDAAEKAGEKDAWVFTLDGPSFIPFMTHCCDSSLRKELWLAYGTRCVGGDYDNLPLIRDIVEKKNARAKLLGYAHHADYVLERRMAATKETLDAFFDDMKDVVMQGAHRDLEAVRAVKERSTGDAVLHPWDYSYYSEKLKKETFDFEEEELRPYFELENTLSGVFGLCKTLWGINFQLTEALPVYKPDVRVYELTDRGGHELGILYVDPHPRPTKRNGAWMADLLGQGMWSGEVRRPVVGIVCNATAPVTGTPSLLSFSEVNTFFHEFGHALHELLTQCTYRSVSGVNVFWDFVELPSQLLENWLREPDVLRMFAKHYETGEVLPDSLIEKIQQSATFQKGYAAARQLSFGILDLTWYTTDPADIGDDLIGFEKSATEEFRLFPVTEGMAMSPSFQHIFSGGYSAGYYSYKWAEVLEADAFEAFKEEGVCNPRVAARYRDTILAKGGSEHPMKLYKDFRGREPDPKALLRRDGLL